MCNLHEIKILHLIKIRSDCIYERTSNRCLNITKYILSLFIIIQQVNYRFKIKNINIYFISNKNYKNI